MPEYKNHKFAGEEEYRTGPLSVECPYCGQPPGFSCRKTGGQKYVGHSARSAKAKAQIEREAQLVREGYKSGYAV